MPKVLIVVSLLLKTFEEIKMSKLSFKKMSEESNGGTFEKPEALPVGAYDARIARITTIGKHKATDWQTKEVKLNKSGKPIINDVVFIEFELDEQFVTINGEQLPRWVGKEYAISFADLANFNKLVKKLGVDNWEDMLGMAVSVQIGLTATGNNKVTDVSKLSDKAASIVSPLQTPEKSLIFEFDNPDAVALASVPQFLKEKMKQAENYQGSACAKILEGLPSTERKPAAKPSVKAKAKPDDAEFNFDDSDVPF
jgi:hypothetical protein